MRWPTEEELTRARRALVQELREKGIHDARVLSAIEKVPRHLFVLPEYLFAAYDDRPLPIGLGQTISQPYIVALSTEALELSGEEKVLEIGTGSGYQTAILAELAKEVFTVERLPELSWEAQERLRKLGYTNVHFRVGDGTKGWPEEAPFPAILVTAAAPRLPKSLFAQLSEAGRMVIPVGGRFHQDLWLVRKVGGEPVYEHLCPVTFVPLIGEEGFR